MMNEGLINTKHQINRIEKITSILSSKYKNPSLSNRKDPIDELVFILLTQKTDEKKYLQTFNVLKSKFPKWENLTITPVSELHTILKNTGFGEKRALLLKKLFNTIIERFGKLNLSFLKKLSAEKSENILLQLPGVGYKTARCILLYCFNIPVLPVDIHTYRISIRLGIISRKISYEKSHKILQELIPPKMRKSFHVNCIAHGRSKCTAKNPNCQNCSLKKYCLHYNAEKPYPIEIRPKPFAIDLFSGVGGLTLGFQNAGFSVIQAIDKDINRANTYSENFPKIDFICDDVRNVDPKHILKRYGLRKGDITALIGGPPCQGFSESNSKTRDLNNKLNFLYLEFFRFLEDLMPDWFLIENVRGIKTLANGRILNDILIKASSMGYKAEWFELNASEFGVPQVRRRIFIIGNRLNVPIKCPIPTHGNKKQPFLTVRDAISDLPNLQSGASISTLKYKKLKSLTNFQKLMRENMSDEVQGNLVTKNGENVLHRYQFIKPGENWESIPKQLMMNYKDTTRCHTSIYYRLEWGKPSKVIGNFRKNMLIHPNQDRGLSVREAARLQSFPDSFLFTGLIGSQQQQVADAVPPLLSHAVARYIMSLMKKIK